MVTHGQESQDHPTALSGAGGEALTVNSDGSQQAQGWKFGFRRHNLILNVSLTAATWLEPLWAPWGRHRLALVSSIQDSALPGARGTSVLRNTKVLPNMASPYPRPQSLQIQAFLLKKLQRQNMIGVLRESLLKKTTGARRAQDCATISAGHSK